MLDLSVISGTVVDDRGRPVRRAVVGARSRDDMSVASTNGRGRFALSIVAAEPVRVLARKFGYAMTIDSRVPPGKDDLVLRLERGAELRGRVAGDPLPRRWRLELLRWEGHERVPARGVSMLRRIDGTFSATRLVAGVYELRVSAPGFAEDRVAFDVDAGDLHDAITLRLAR